jgi:hypothetical protein
MGQELEHLFRTGMLSRIEVRTTVQEHKTLHCCCHKTVRLPGNCHDLTKWLHYEQLAERKI